VLFDSRLIVRFSHVHLDRCVMNYVPHGVDFLEVPVILPCIPVGCSATKCLGRSTSLAKDNRITIYDIQLSTGATISPFIWATKYAIAHLERLFNKAVHRLPLGQFPLDFT